MWGYLKEIPFRSWQTLSLSAAWLFTKLFATFILIIRCSFQSITHSIYLLLSLICITLLFSSFFHTFFAIFPYSLCRSFPLCISQDSKKLCSKFGSTHTLLIVPIVLLKILDFHLHQTWHSPSFNFTLLIFYYSNVTYLILLILFFYLHFPPHLNASHPMLSYIFLIARTTCEFITFTISACIPSIVLNFSFFKLHVDIRFCISIIIFRQHWKTFSICSHFIGHS